VRIADLADALIGDRPVETAVVGIRPGEKSDEILISEEESLRTVERGPFRVVLPILPQLRADVDEPPFEGRELSSGDEVLDREAIEAFLVEHGLRVEDEPAFSAVL
jgi:UDP-glucose 4-epimerase